MATNEVTVSVLDHGTLVNKINSRVRLRCNYCGKEVNSYSRLKHQLGGIRGEVTPCLTSRRMYRYKCGAYRLDKKKRLVTLRCNYCGKKLYSYSRLKQHLGGIRGEVTPCLNVPEDVKVQMQNSLSKTKIAHVNNSKQGKNEAVVDFHSHRTLVDDVKKRVRCNYCGKEINSYSLLKYHLVLHEYVVPCNKVPEDVKVHMRNRLLPETNKPDEHREVSESCSSWKRDSSSDDYSPDEAYIDIRDHGTVLDKKKGRITRVRCNYCAKEICNYSRLRQHLGGIRGNVLPCVEVPEVIKVSHNPETINKVKNKAEAEDDSSRQTQRCIGRFFLANGIDFSAANSSTFDKMIHALVGVGSTAYKVPSCNDLKGWILEGELKAMRDHVQEVVCSWGSTGCSILLDGWTNEKGRNMINFVVDSPLGPIFMKSADFSDSIGNVDSMISLLSGVIEEVGVENVVQIVTYSTAASMEAVGMLGTERGILGKAKTISKFIYSHETVLKLMKEHTRGFDIVSSSRIRSMMPFLILETIEAQKKNLREMFISLEWKNSTLASTADGRMVAGLVTGEPSFWAEAEMLVKVKETIKKIYKGRKTEYQPLWTVIDGIWDDQLHSPIHAAGYYLNPGLFYFKDFYADDKVKAGLLCCIVRIVEDEREQDLIASQFDEYRNASGAFGDGDAVCQRAKLAPAKWWSLYGGECPELQQFAIRILSQTCTGALRYGLKRSLTEELHMEKERNCLEQKWLSELTFVHHSLWLQNLPASNFDYTDTSWTNG
ncbi:hypothetical protein C5167_015603 [Papaver somniferum]|uniref:C2H2-type domain-containing protein n=1 Tax=Papaver somniferum TaxID=3469 RepID=A0A4Y7J9Y1_PAPSO|nr:hypothetical protein C5167_015603 [Papaver somniferum]